MRTCAYCGFQNPADIHICLRCAASLARVCPACGIEVQAGNRFCGQCGARLEEEAPAAVGAAPAQLKTNLHERMLKDLRARMPSTLLNKISQESRSLLGQRREVTVLFVEMTHSGAAQAMDSEALYLASDQIMRVMADIIYKYEGTIDKFTSDGLMALFGIPLNHENDPERAVRAALEMQQAMGSLAERLEEQFPGHFHIRIGINTGSVIAGHMSNQQHIEYTVIGDTINLASWLKLACEPGAILVSFSAYQRTRPIFDYQTISALSIKDVQNPVQAFRPVALRMIPGQMRGLPGLRAPLVGRAKDLSKLTSAFETVISRKLSQIVVLSGEAGIGKTRLVSEMHNAFAGQPVSIFQGTCAAYMRITPYRVVADLLRNLLQVSDLDSEVIQREALQQRLGQLDLDQTDILPYLLHVLGILKSDPILEIRINLLEPTMLQRQTLLALRSFLVAEARLSPTALVFDDLHWVDQASRQFLEYFCRSLESVPILLVLISREWVREEHPPLINAAAHQHPRPPVEVVLAPLSDSDSGLLLDQLIQKASPEMETLKAAIIERAGGNPYYTEELVRILMDRGGLVQRAGQWAPTEIARQVIREIPGTLQDVILARLDRLPAPLREVLQNACPLGRSFAVSLLHALVGGPVETLLAHLGELEDRHFITRSPFGLEDGYTFNHPLLQITIYNTFLKRDVRRLHLQIAQAIETGTHWLPGERNEILAYHYSESSNPSRAIPYLLASADKASQQYANETVVQLYRQALPLMEEQPKVYESQIAHARIGLSQALKLSGEFDDAKKMLEQVILRPPVPGEPPGPPLSAAAMLLQVDALRELADVYAREGDLDYAIRLLKTGQELLGESGRREHPAQWRRLADRLAWVYFRQGKLEESYNQADLALLNVQASEADDPITLASLYNTLGGIYWTRRRLPEAIESVKHSLEIYRSFSYTWGVAVALTNLGVLYFSLGKWAEALNNLEEADRLRRENGYDTERPINLKNMGEMLISVGDFENARQKLDTSREISVRLGMDLHLCYVELGLCNLAVTLEDYPKAAVHLRNSRELLDLTQINDRVSQYYRYQALVEIQHGEQANALASAQKSLEIADQGGYIDGKIDAFRVLGNVQTRLGDFEQAETNLQKSVELAQAYSERYSEAKAMLELGQLYLAWSQVDQTRTRAWIKQAETFLESAIHIFETLGARNDLLITQNTRNRIPSDQALKPLPKRTQELNQQIAALRASLGIPEGEWYQAVILTLLLVPQQEASEEYVFETIAYLISPLMELVQQKDAQVIRQQDRLTLVFGAPVAHEDDPVQAVETAMEIINFYAELHQQTNLPVTIRLGISMGKIVAGRIGADSKSELIAAGEPLQIAGQIAEVCPPMRVWVTQAVRNATAHRFEYAPLAPSVVAHLEESTVFQLEGLREQILPVRGLIGLKSPFVGRDREIQAMLQVSQGLARSAGGLIWLQGDAGIGKSRLMREFAALAAERGMQVWRGTCTSRRIDHAFSLFSDMLTQAIDIQPNFSPNQIYEQIEHKLGLWPPELGETRPVIEMLSGVQPTGVQGERLVALEPEQFRRQTFVALHRVVSALASRQPLVMIFDDIQWIDSISADLLLYLSNLVVTHPVMIVCARRQNDPSPFEEVLSRIQRLHAERSTHLPLRPLSINDCRLLLDQFLSAANLPEAIKSLIVQQSGGNPYFIEEFVRMLVEQDYLRLVRGRLEVNQTLKADKLSIPSSLETLIRSRVDSLPAPARHLLQVAAVISQRFNPDLLARIAERREVEVHLELLHTRGMLNHTPEEDYWELSHPLIEAIVYNTVLRAQRKVLHRHTAIALEAQWQGSESDHAEDLAYHYGKAEEYDKTLHYLLLAGERAAARYANDTAVAHFEQAMSILASVQRASDELRWRIISGLGEVYQFIGNYDASLSALQSGLELAHSPQLSPEQRAGLYRRLAETASKKGDQAQAIAYLQDALETLGEIQDPLSQAEAARIYARLSWSFFRQAELEPARQAALQAEIYARYANNLNALAMAQNYLGGIYYRQGDLQQALQHTRAAMTCWQEIGYTWGAAVVLSNLGILEVVAGNWSAGFEAFERVLKMRQDMGDIEGVAITHNNLGSLACDRGSLDVAEGHMRNSLAISIPFQMSWQTANSSSGLAEILLYQGRLQDALESLEQARGMASEINARDVLADLGPIEAEICLAMGDLVKAERTAREAAQMASEIGSNPLVAAAWRAAAASLLRQGQPHAAHQALDQAWQALEQADDELETGRTHAQAVRIFQALDDQTQAETHRRIALSIFHRLGAARDLSLLQSQAS